MADDAVSHGLWFDSARGSAPRMASLEGAVSADVAVIGGGFTGLSAALHLAEQGTRVVVLEAERLGHGASGRNGGHVSPGLRVGRDTLLRRFGEAGDRLYHMAQQAPDFLTSLVQRHDLRCSFERHGVFRLAHSAKALAATYAMYRDYSGHGIGGLRMIEGGDLEGKTGTRRYLGALYDPRGASVHPLELVRELGRASLRHGARIHERTAARTLERIKSGWRVRCDHGYVDADQVIVATNAYSGNLVRGLGRSILPVSSFQIATEPLDQDSFDSVLPGGQTAHDTRRLVLYFRKSPDRRLLLGGRASFSSSSDSLKGTADFEILRNVLVDIFPQLGGTRITHHWGGLVCITPDQVPHYHEPAAGLYVMLGYCGRGVALANRAGAWLANRILGQDDEADVPRVALRSMPLHGLREPVLNLVMRYHCIMDRMGR